MKKLGGCSVTPSSAAKFDWSVGIFATTVTQSGLAANAAAKHVNCQNLMPPAPQIFFFLQGSSLLAFFFVAQRVSVLTGAIFAEVCGISATIPKRAYSAARRWRHIIVRLPRILLPSGLSPSHTAPQSPGSKLGAVVAAEVAARIGNAPRRREHRQGTRSLRGHHRYVLTRLMEVAVTWIFISAAIALLIAISSATDVSFRN